MTPYTWAVIIGVMTGFFSRLRMLRTDYRQYPTYLHGQVIHLSLGFIAAGLGAVAVPALLEKEYTAITFLSLAAQQFREVRNMERESLSKLDQMELVKRGPSYIEGIAMAFEGRNYLVILTAFLTSLTVVVGTWYLGILVGLVAIVITGVLQSGKNLGQITEVRPGELRMEEAGLYVDDIYLMNVGLKENRQRILDRGIGIIIEPKNVDSRITLANAGQRQAILHDASTILGVYRDTGEPSLTPISKRDLEDGRLGVLLLPEDRNEERAIRVVQKVPVLESAVRLPEEQPDRA
ncbi:YIEGIA family protein [Paludifilum halophilum]|uniref:YIEGIA family protein n=1 Tax=Paludifilum halophilum TaxID=1642702 RepID=UPI0019825E7D|nr:YIEGIA family protein [Paludifilum halophilum]